LKNIWFQIRGNDQDTAIWFTNLRIDTSLQGRDGQAPTILHHEPVYYSIRFACNITIIPQDSKSDRVLWDLVHFEPGPESDLKLATSTRFEIYR
jgi:hypothetical protein